MADPLSSFDQGELKNWFTWHERSIPIDAPLAQEDDD